MPPGKVQVESNGNDKEKKLYQLFHLCAGSNADDVNEKRDKTKQRPVRDGNKWGEGERNKKIKRQRQIILLLVKIYLGLIKYELTFIVVYHFYMVFFLFLFFTYFCHITFPHFIPLDFYRISIFFFGWFCCCCCFYFIIF